MSPADQLETDPIQAAAPGDAQAAAANVAALDVAALDAEALERHRAETERPTHAVGFTLWKRRTARAFLRGGDGPPVRFHADLEAAIDAAKRDGGRVAAWSARAPEDALARCRAAGIEGALVEDGFLRSVGLGQDLRLPASLIIDRTGVHYDPSGPSDLERAISAAAGLGAEDPLRLRAAQFVYAATDAGLTKYAGERGASAPAGSLRCAVDRETVLVVGQVETDASVRLGASPNGIRTNAALLRAARAGRPDAYLIWRPHPDVVAGYRPGRVGAETERLADAVVSDGPAGPLLDRAAEIWTMTSLMGFEALIRGKRAVCLGWPFYAGWGLTEDLGTPPEGLPLRRAARPDRTTLAAAAYLLYPRYLDPLSGKPCAPETVLKRLVARDAAAERHPDPLIRAAAWARRRAARLAARFGRSL